MPITTRTKLTVKQRQVLLEKAYNKHLNEVFELHKYLVDCPLTDHDIGDEDPITDAIELIKKMVRKKPVHVELIKKLEAEIITFKLGNAWRDMEDAPTDGTRILLNVETMSHHSGHTATIGFYNTNEDICRTGWSAIAYSNTSALPIEYSIGPEVAGWKELPE